MPRARAARGIDQPPGWNNYPSEIAQVTQLVAQYTNTARGQGGTPAASTSTSTTPVPAGGQGCVPMSGPTVPGAGAHILPNGLAAIPQGAPPAVSRDDRRPQPDHPLPIQLGGGHTPVSMKVPARGGGLPARAGAAPRGRGTCQASRLCPTPPPQIWAALLGVAETTEFVPLQNSRSHLSHRSRLLLLGERCHVPVGVTRR